MPAILFGSFAAIFFIVFIVMGLCALVRRVKIKKQLRKEGFPNFETFFVTSLSDITKEKFLNELCFFIIGKWDNVQSTELIRQLSAHRTLEWLYIVSYTISLLSFLIYLSL
jgi:Ca2+/Na+ antiporter